MSVLPGGIRDSFGHLFQSGNPVLELHCLHFQVFLFGFENLILFFDAYAFHVRNGRRNCVGSHEYGAEGEQTDCHYESDGGARIAQTVDART